MEQTINGENGLGKKVALALFASAIGSLPACPGLGGNVYETGLGPYVACYVRDSIGLLQPVYSEATCDHLTDPIDVP